MDLSNPLGSSVAMEFNTAGVQKPVASAVKMAQHGSCVVLDADGLYVANKSIGKQLEVRVEDGTFVVDI